MTSIAFDYLSDIEKAQLLHFRPDLRPIGMCKRCGGQIIANHGKPMCLQCSARHNEDGGLIPTYSGVRVSKEQMSRVGIDNEH
ncbi:hypothetical protein ES703_98186 [subsurface metagenome]